MVALILVAFASLALICDGNVLDDFAACQAYKKFNFWGALGDALVQHCAKEIASPALLDSLHVMPSEICMLSFFYGAHAALRAVTLPNKQAYADRHGYRLFTESDFQETTARSTDPWMLKLSRTVELLSNAGCEWVFWNDADAFFNRPETRLEEFIAYGPDRNLILSWDGAARGACPDSNDAKHAALKDADRTLLRLNSGHWFARRAEWTLDFLTHASTLTKENRRIVTYWHDQGAIAEEIHLRGLQAVEERRYLFFDLNAFNAHVLNRVSAALAGAFVLHRPGACRNNGGNGGAVCAQTMSALMAEAAAKQHTEL